MIEQLSEWQVIAGAAAPLVASEVIGMSKLKSNSLTQLLRFLIKKIMANVGFCLVLALLLASLPALIISAILMLYLFRRKK